MISEEDVPIAQYAVRREPPATRILTPMVGYCQDPAGLTAQQPLGAALKLRLIARNGGREAKAIGMHAAKEQGSLWRAWTAIWTDKRSMQLVERYHSMGAGLI